MNHITISTKIGFYGLLQKNAEVFKLYSQGRYLSKEAKDRMRRAILSREETKLLESIGGLTKGTPRLKQDKTVAPVQKQNPCILGTNKPLHDPKIFTSTYATFQAPARLPPLRVTDAIKRSYLWGQRMNALKSREKSLGKIEMTPDYSAPAEVTNIREAVLAKQETTPVQKQNPCILGINRPLPDPKSFTSTCDTFQAPARLPPLRETNTIKRSYLWGQRMNALKSREKSLGKIELTPDNSAAAEVTNIRRVVLAKQETKVLKAINSITKGTSKVSQAKTTEPMAKNVPCILQFNRSSSDPPKRFISSRTSQGQHRGFPQLRGADEIKQSYLKRQFMNMQRSRDKVPKAEPLTPDNDPTKNGKWR